MNDIEPGDEITQSCEIPPHLKKRNVSIQAWPANSRVQTHLSGYSTRGARKR